MRDPYPPWQQRSSDYRNLFNPAFLMLLTCSACEAYEFEQARTGKADKEGMPYALFFLAVPLAVSKQFNNARPTRVAGSLVNWLGKQPVISVELSNAAYSLVPAVREGILFALQGGYIKLDESGLFQSGEVTVDRRLAQEIELKSHIENAQFIGRWLAKSGSPATILEAFGLRP